MSEFPLLARHFDFAEVAASVVIAAMATYAALTLAGRVGALRGRQHSRWLGGGGIVMGLGIAAMHFVGMHNVVGRGLSTSVIGVALLILIVATTAAMLDRGARRDFHATKVTLEHRVAEREAEAAMATELYRLLAENATDMVSTHRPDGRFDYATQTWSEFVGVPIEQVVGHLPAEFAHPDDVPLLIENHSRGLKASQMLSTVWRCRRGFATSGEPTYAWIETTTRPVREALNGRVQTFVCTSRDVTERKRMEEQLARSETRFRAALDGSFDAFFVLEAVRDAHGKLIDFIFSELNPRAEAILARHRSAVLGRRITEVSPAAAYTHLPKFAAVVDSRVPLEEEVELHSAGSPRWFHHQVIPLGDGVAVTSRDVTDRKQAEEELRTLTLVDDLTGLYNRRGFRMLAEQHMRLVKRGGPISLLVCFDLDDFKRVNDVYGHAEGDAALRQAANIIRSTFRDSDIMARVGGDEFVVLALDCGEMMEQIIGRIDAAVDAHNHAAARPYSISMSLGTARLDPFTPVKLDALIALADANLYEAKRRRAAVREMMA